MINTLRSELIKVRTVRMNWVIGLIALAFPLLVCALTAGLRNIRDITSSDLVGFATGTSVVTALLLGVIAAVSITSEFAHGTIRPTFVATPSRWRVIIAKGLVACAFAALVEVIVVIAALAISYSLASSRGATITFSEITDRRPAIIGVIVFTVLVTILGYGLGLLIRSTPAAICVLILWPLLVENILGGILSAAGVKHPVKYLPYASGIQMANPDGVTEGLGRVAGGLYFGGVAIAICLVGAVIASRRDA